MNYLVLAYGGIWMLLFVYLFGIHKQQKHLESMLEMLVQEQGD